MATWDHTSVLPTNFRTQNMTSTFVQTPATPDTGETVKGSEVEVFWTQKKRESCCCLCPIFTFRCMRPENI